MDKNKIVVWTSIIGSVLLASLATSMTFFKDQTIIITSVSTLVSAIIAFLVTTFKKEA
jgi:hypothetical protein